MSKRVIYFWGIVIGLLLIICTSIYFTLGGFDQIEVIKQPGMDRVIIGDAFHGSPEDSLALAIFEDYQSQLVQDAQGVESERKFENLIVVNYRTDSATVVDQFIGLVVRGKHIQVPLDQEIRAFQSNQRFIAFLSQHPLVRPPAYKVEDMIRNQASEEGLTISFFQEIYYMDNSAAIEGWVLEE